jgi:hypothetical protein
MCRLSYHYKYVENLRRKRKSRPLQFGSIIHNMIEADANGDDPFELLDKIEIDNGKMFQAEIDIYGELIQDVADIMEDYFEYWEGSPKAVRYLEHDGKFAEHEFAIEIDDGILCKGKIDAAAKSRGLKWMTEHKSWGRMPSEDHRWRNIQSSIYLRVNDMLGWFKGLDGTLWDYVHSKAPTKPKPLKSGNLSTKNVNTLPSTVSRTLRQLKIPRARAQGLIKAAEANRSKYFDRIYTPRNDAVIDVLFNEFIDTSREMSALHGKSKARSIGRHCEYCDFEGLCRAELLGHDVDFIKEREYTTEKEDATKTDETIERVED